MQAVLPLGLIRYHQKMKSKKKQQFTARMKGYSRSLSIDWNFDRTIILRNDVQTDITFTNEYTSTREQISNVYTFKI
jgi:hypothetical protein